MDAKFRSNTRGGGSLGAYRFAKRDVDGAFLLPSQDAFEVSVPLSPGSVSVDEPTKPAGSGKWLDL